MSGSVPSSRFPEGLALFAKGLVQVALAVFLLPVTLGADPRLGVQGRLQDSQGNPETGGRDITTFLHADLVGGSPFLIETQSVALDADGNFFAGLGNGTPLDPTSFAHPVWISWTLEGESEELGPRLPLVPVPTVLRVPVTDGVQVLGDLDLDGRAVSQVATPTSSGDAVNRAFVDGNAYTPTQARADLGTPGDLETAGRIQGISPPLAGADLSTLEILEEKISGGISTRSDVSTASAGSGMVLIWDGSTWVPGPTPQVNWPSLRVSGAGTPAENGMSLRDAIEGMEPFVGVHRTVLLGPGVYDLGAAPLSVRPGVHLVGAGASRTFIAADAGVSPLRLPAPGSEGVGTCGVHGLSVEAADGAAITIEAPGWALALNQVALEVGGLSPVGVEAVAGAKVALRDSRIEITGSHPCYGILTTGGVVGELHLRSVRIDVDCSGDANGVFAGGAELVEISDSDISVDAVFLAGVQVAGGSTLRIRDTAIDLLGSQAIWGIRHNPGAPGVLELEGVHLRAKSGIDLWGVDSHSATRVRMSDSVFLLDGPDAPTYGIFGRGWQDAVLTRVEVRAEATQRTNGLRIEPADPPAGGVIVLDDLHVEVLGTGSAAHRGVYLHNSDHHVIVRGGTFRSPDGVSGGRDAFRSHQVYPVVPPPIVVLGGVFSASQNSLVMSAGTMWVKDAIVDAAEPIQGLPRIACFDCTNADGTAVGEPAATPSADRTYLDEPVVGLAASFLSEALLDSSTTSALHATSPGHFSMGTIQLTTLSLSGLGDALEGTEQVIGNMAMVDDQVTFGTHADVALGGAGEDNLLRLGSGAWSPVAPSAPGLGTILANGSGAEGGDPSGIGLVKGSRIEDQEASLLLGYVFGTRVLEGPQLTVSASSGSELRADASGLGTVRLAGNGEDLRLAVAMNAVDLAVKGAAPIEDASSLARRDSVDPRLLLAPGDTLGVRRDLDTADDCPGWGTWSYEVGSGDVGYCTLMGPQ